MTDLPALTTDAALLRAVLSAPDDDLPRLVIADWWDENGQPERAEFCRVQCEMPLWFDDAKWMDQFGPLPYPEIYIRCCEWLKGDQCAAEFGPSRGGDWIWNREHQSGVIGTYRRGFISAVSAPLALLYGGVCGRCEQRHLQARRLADAEMTSANFENNISDELTQSLAALFGTCPACNGIGRTVGHLPAVCAAHPVQTVTVTDREPLHGQTWYREGREGPDSSVPPTAELPAPLFDALGGPYHRDSPLCRWKSYEAGNFANAAASAALLAWAKSSAVPRGG